MAHATWRTLGVCLHCPRLCRTSCCHRPRLDVVRAEGKGLVPLAVLEVRVGASAGIGANMPDNWSTP
eukprot:scaffold87941_cov30-Tisochrysis_lutea.AAC.1